MKKPPYEMMVEKTSTGYSAYCEAVGAYTTGPTADELKANIVAVLNMAVPAAGDALTLEDVKLTCDLQSFFDTYKVINASALAKRVGMPQSLLSQYVSGIKKPGEKQVRRILDGIRQVGRELAEMDFA